MYSHRLVVRNNVALRSRDQGLMFNYANDAVIAGNAVQGGSKCEFLYNANNNRFEFNRSEEHTSELQSLMRISYAVFCLKKKKHTNRHKRETKVHERINTKKHKTYTTNN